MKNQAILLKFLKEIEDEYSLSYDDFPSSLEEGKLKLNSAKDLINDNLQNKLTKILKSTNNKG